MIEATTPQGVSETPPNRQQVADLRAALPVLSRGLEPASPNEIKRMIGKLALLFPASKRNEQEELARVELYADLLSDLPLDALGAAFRKAAQTMKFFPQVAEIRSIAEAEVTRREWQKWRAEYLIRLHEREWQEDKPVSEEERKKVATLAADLARKLSTSNGPRTA